MAAEPRVSRDEVAARATFDERYGRPDSGVVDAMEARVIGGTWGANGFTTVAQADELGRRLRLQPGHRLLDLGTGRGWPGLYLAKESGCSFVGADLPFDALASAMDRARREGMAARASVAVASGAALPFHPGSFDAVVLTDVLC